VWVGEQFAERSGNRYKIEVFPASSLGKETDINEGLGLGTVDIIYTGQLFAGRSYGPIAIGGTVVRQGDVVIGDADGVAVVPFERLAQVTAGSLQLLEDEKVKLARAASGQADTSFLVTSLTILEA
jgi:dUTPase